LTFTDLSRLQRNGARGVEDSMLRRQTIEQTMERLPQGVRRLAVQLRTPIGAIIFLANVFLFAD